MRDYRTELINQVDNLAYWLDIHAYDDKYTQKKANTLYIKWLKYGLNWKGEMVKAIGDR